MPEMRFTGKVSFVEKNGSTFARASFVKDGKRKQVWRKVDGKKSDAKDAVIKEIEDQLSDKEAPKTFRELAAYYEHTKAQPARFEHDQKVAGTKTYRQLRHILNQLTNYFGDTPLDRIRRDQVEKYRLYIIDKPVKHIRDDKPSYGKRSLASVNQHLRTLRTVLNKAEQLGWIDKKVNFHGLIAHAAEAKREAYPTQAEFKRILEATQARQRLNHIKPIVLMIADTGARPVELWQLKWTDVDFEKANVTYTSDKGVRRTRRTIPMSQRAMDELNKLPRLNEYVFGGIKAVKRGWKSIQKLANTDVDLYSLRHLFATRIDLMPISQNQKQKLMGHTSAAMFGRYAKLTGETLEEVRDMLNGNPYLPVQDATTSAPS